ERLCEFDNIVAVKEASGDLVQITEIHSRCGDRLAILSGEDALTLPMLACGGIGTISVTANILPARMRDMIDAFFAGDMRRARDLHEQLLPVTRALFIETNPIPVKTAMRELGMAAGPLRLPLVDMAEQNKAVLLDVLKKWM
ncbi:MAG: 4-hydroxy-tetrahydrodipicolinate synthase, partial [Chitinivibrionales bacterium]|nr:4-hydroxy-tetrahydrodipicolinate synthase [Chitinivibrionales bacterium]